MNSHDMKPEAPPLWLYDFLEVARHLSITVAASRLNKSQSSLSRHIKQIEQSVGFELFENRNNRLTLTPAGREFAEGLHPIFDSYNELVDRCRDLSGRGLREVKAQRPSYTNCISSDPYYSFLEDIESNSGELVISYVRLYQSSPFVAVREGLMDVAIAYDYGPEDAFRSSMAETGLSAKHLASTPLDVWVDAASEWAREAAFTVEELAEIPILFPDDEASPLRPALEKLFAERGLQLNMSIVNTANQTEFMRTRRPQCAFVFPRGIRSERRILSRKDLKGIELGGVFFDVYALARSDDDIAFAFEG